MKAAADVIREIERLYSEYEKEVLETSKAGLLEKNTVKTYLLHSQNFVRWCHDDFIPGGRNIKF